MLNWFDDFIETVCKLFIEQRLHAYLPEELGYIDNLRRYIKGEANLQCLYSNDLPNKKTRPAQAKVLNIMGINHKITPDGKVKILRAHIIKEFDGDLSVIPQIDKACEPNWDNLNT